MIKNLGKRKLSIKQEVFYLGVVFSLVTLLLFGGILCTSIYFMQVNHAKQALHDSNYHMAMIAKNQSRAISNTLQVLSNNPDVRTAGFKKNTIIDFRNALENKHSMTLEDKLRTKKICDVAMIEMGIKGDE